MRKVAVLGVGCTKVGEHWGTSLKDLFTEAALAALNDAGSEKVEALYVGNMFSGYAQQQEHLGALLADSIGMSGISAAKIEGACGSGGAAVHAGYLAVASGMYDYVLVGGVEKMTDVSTAQVTTALMMAENRDYIGFTGITFVGLNALLHRLYTKTYGAKLEEIAAFAVNDHNNAVNNPYAQYPFPLKIERVLESPIVADPIRLFECCGVGDGAAAIVLCPLDNAKALAKGAVELAASTVATNVLSLNERDDLLVFDATRKAANKAYEIAGLKPEDVDVLEVHDAFTITGVLALEGLGFAKKGEGAKFVSEGNIALGGKIPTNTLGGLKARGHPIGATGVYQVIEVAKQLRGDAGKNQINGAEVGLTQNVGGVDSTAAVHVLRRCR